MLNKIRTRFAPSPTGPLHVGGARTALFNYLFAKQNKGKFILRIEDTDKERSKKEFENSILESLKWLGLNWNEGPFYQSQRNDIYVNYAKKLLKKGLAYVEKGNKGTDKAIIYHNPKETVEFKDIIRGPICFKPDTQKDIVLIKSDGSAAYNFAVVVDDAEMEITHVIRGEDHIPNTPKQIPLYKALGFKIPKFCHLPLILGSDKSKMSKRHGAVSVMEYKNQGYLPEALINFLGLLGWNPGDDKELFSMNELIRIFSLEKIQKGGAVFNIEKLDWFDKEYNKNIPKKEFNERVSDYLGKGHEKWKKDNPKKWEGIVNTRKTTMRRVPDIKNILETASQKPNYPKSLLKTPQYIDETIKLLEALSPQSFSKEEVKKAIWDYAEKEGRGNVLWPFRVALTGLEKSPDPFSVAEILGKKETLERLEHAKKINS